MSAKPFFSIEAWWTGNCINPGAWIRWYRELVQRMESGAPLVVHLACNRPEKVAKKVTVADKRPRLEFEIARPERSTSFATNGNAVNGMAAFFPAGVEDVGTVRGAAQKLTQAVEIVSRMKSRLLKYRETIFHGRGLESGSRVAADHQQLGFGCQRAGGR